MKNEIKKYCSQQELAAIVADPQLAALLRADLVMADVQAGFYRLFEGENEFHFAYFVARAIERPFHHFLLTELLPSSESLAGCPNYWAKVLSYFTTDYVFRYHETRRGESLCFDKKLPINLASVVGIAAFAAWLKSICEFADMAWFGQMEPEFCHKLWCGWHLASKFRRLFYMFAVRAVHRSSLVGRLENGVILHCFLQSLEMVQKSAKFNPLTARNMAFSVCSFLEEILPMLERRFSAGDIKHIFKENFGQLHAHWVLRKNRKLALLLQFQSKVQPELWSVEARLPYKWLPAFMLCRMNDDIMGALVGHVLSGKSVRSFEGLPVKLSAKAAHFFMLAPAEISGRAVGLYEALHFARAMAAGLSLEMSLALIEFFRSKCNPDWTRTAFFEEVCFFVKKVADELAEGELQTLLDFFHHEKTDNAPFSLNGRTLQSVRRLIVDWHLELAQNRFGQKIPKDWAPVALNEFQHETKAGKRFAINEITTRKDILAEGAAMHHCVATYAHGCAAGQHSIWSLREIDQNMAKPLVTIQVTADRKIVQARGHCNRMPVAVEIDLIGEWCHVAGLEIVRF